MTDTSTAVVDEREFDRQRASWLELFYDLAYVAAIAQLTYLLIESSGDILEYAQFILIFFMVFLSWLGAVVYRNIRGEAEDTYDRVATLIQMFFALVMSVFIQEAFGVGAAGFIIGYVGTRIVAISLFEYANRLQPENAPRSKNVIWGLRIAVLIWLASIYVPQPFQTLVWLLALSIELIVPFTQGIFSRHIANPRRMLNKFHLPERLGLFTILVMGESLIVVAVVNNIADGLITLTSGIIATASFLIVVGLWWLYFNHVERFAMGKPFRLFPYLYSHLPILIGVMFIAVGTKIGMLEKVSGPDPFWFVVIGVVVTLFGFNALKFATGQRVFRIFWPTAIFVVVISLGAFLNSVSFVYALYTLAALFGLYIYLENKQCRIREVPGIESVAVS